MSDSERARPDAASAPPEPVPDAPETPEAETHQKAVVRGTSATAISSLASQFIRLASNLIITRLLYPEAFGLMALVFSVQRGLHMMSDLGTRPSIIQNERGEDPRFLGTAFSIETVRGLALGILLALGAYPISHYYKKPELFGLLVMISLFPIMEGLFSPKLALLQRHLKLGVASLIELGGQLSAVFTAIGIAYFTQDPSRSVDGSGGGSYWALPAAVLATGLFKLVTSHMLAGPKIRFTWDPAAAHEIFHMGKWIFLSTLITFFANDLDVLVLGKLVSDRQLGLFQIGSILASLPLIVGGKVIGDVMLPALSRIFREDPTKVATTFDQGRSLILTVGLFVCLGTGLYAKPFFGLLYDQRYHTAGLITFLLMVKVWFTFIQEAYTRATLAIGEARALVMANVARLAAVIALGYVGYLIGKPLGFEFEGFLAGVGFGSSAGAFAVGWSLRDRGMHMGWAEVRFTAALVILGLAGHLADTLYAPQLLPYLSFLPARFQPILLSTAVASLIVVPVGLWTLLRLRQAMRARHA